MPTWVCMAKSFFPFILEAVDVFGHVVKLICAPCKQIGREQKSIWLSEELQSEGFLASALEQLVWVWPCF